MLAYVVCLASMAAQAAVTWLAARGSADEGLARRAAIGGLLFMTSDTLLAFNKFSVPVPLSALWILATYWIAQGLIAGVVACAVRGLSATADDARGLPLSSRR